MSDTILTWKDKTVTSARDEMDALVHCETAQEARALMILYRADVGAEVANENVA